jgi:hypothetical protein
MIDWLLPLQYVKGQFTAVRMCIFTIMLVDILLDAVAALLDKDPLIDRPWSCSGIRRRKNVGR